MYHFKNKVYRSFLHTSNMQYDPRQQRESMWFYPMNIHVYGHIPSSPNGRSSRHMNRYTHPTDTGLYVHTSNMQYDPHQQHYHM